MPLLEPPVIDPAARAALQGAPEQDWWTGTRLKKVRHTELSPGGRVALTLFESVEDTHLTTGRPHPRLRVSLPPVDDAGTESAFKAPDDATHNATAAAFAEWLSTAWDTASAELVGELPDDVADTSREWHRNSLRTQRTARFFASASAHVDDALPAAERAAARAALRTLEDRAYAGDIQFDDHDTGTYHSFGHDAPFVHYLESVLEALPEAGSAAMALLSPAQAESVRRQRKQARAHLDHLMRHKYAFEKVVESDIEKQLGGLLIDRQTRHIASETPESAEQNVPAYELLRIAPTAEHAHAGAWLHRAADALRLRDGTEVEVEDDLLRRIPVEASRLTFERMPGDARLRAGVRVDWDGNGWIQPGEIGWVSWAGHCDIKAVMEQVGITLTGAEADTSVTEYRSDTGGTTVYNRDLVLEMVASAMELGSTYLPTDGSDPIRRGITRFGGARNDSRPDRFQLAGSRPGQSLRWPLSQRADTLVVTEVELKGEKLDLAKAFYRWHPDPEAIDFAANPRFVKTIEGDTSLLDISGVYGQNFLSQFTNHNENESLGGRETGWFKFWGHVANSSAATIASPGIYGVYVERVGQFAAADLPFEQGSRDGHILPRSIFGDNSEGSSPVGVDAENIQRRLPGSLLVYPEFDNLDGHLTLLTVTNSSATEEVRVHFVYRGKYGLGI